MNVLVFIVGLILSIIVYIASALMIGQKHPDLHYIVTGLLAVMAFINTCGDADLVASSKKAFCTGFWIPIAVMILIRFGEEIIPRKKTETKSTRAKSR
jgi:hypothetical protein